MTHFVRPHTLYQVSHRAAFSYKITVNISRIQCMLKNPTGEHITKYKIVIVLNAKYITHLVDCTHHTIWVLRAVFTYTIPESISIWYMIWWISDNISRTQMWQRCCSKSNFRTSFFSIISCKCNETVNLKYFRKFIVLSKKENIYYFCINSLKFWVVLEIYPHSDVIS